jgi:hypothetical protein
LLEPKVDIATSSLNFKEFSYWNEESKTMQNVGNDYSTALLYYLLEKFGVTRMQESLPFLILWCGNDIPPPDKRPFSIAGCIAVWLTESDPSPSDLFIGDWGESDDIKIDEDLAADLVRFHMPRDDTLLRLVTQYFPGADGISFISHTVIVEYPLESESSWKHRVQILPAGFSNAGISLNVSNGPLLTMELKRLKTPKPGILAALEEDDSDYVKSQGCFYPGVMLHAKNGDQISAGVAVERGSETRLSVAFHCWQQEYAETPDKLGDPNHFSVTQGETAVGYVEQRIGTTDIGLAKLKEGVVFQNRFLDIPTTAQSLLSSNDIEIGDDFLLDSFVTGRQRLRCLGKHIKIEGDREVLKGPQNSLPGPGTYIRLRQGIYASGSPEIHGVPKIRAGVCGSAIVRVKKAGKAGETVLQNGEVAGFMHWSDLQHKYDTGGSLLCFADAVDELISAGWKIVQVPEKHDVSDEDSRTSKKQRT